MPIQNIIFDANKIHYLLKNLSITPKGSKHTNRHILLHHLWLVNESLGFDYSFKILKIIYVDCLSKPYNFFVLDQAIQVLRNHHGRNLDEILWFFDFFKKCYIQMDAKISTIFAGYSSPALGAISILYTFNQLVKNEYDENIESLKSGKVIDSSLTSRKLEEVIGNIFVRFKKK